MRLLAWTLAGPTIWAVVFSLVYALHGAGCALGWQHVEAPLGSIHRLVLTLTWSAGLVACGVLLAMRPAGEGREAYLPRAGAWIGLGAMLFTLFPVVFASTC